MKYICKIEEVRTEKPELYCIAKKQEVKQKLIVEFLNQKCISQAERDAFKEKIKAERAKDDKKYMTVVKEEFLSKFYKNVEKPKKADGERYHFEDGIK